MKLLLLAALGLATIPALSPQEATKPGSKIPAFTAQAMSSVDSQSTPVPTVYMIVGVKCSATPRYEKRFKAVEDEFRAKGVDFVWVFPNKTETKEEKAGWMKKVGLKGPWIDDEGAKITKALECKNTAQAILADKGGKILFRGGIDDNGDESAVQKRFLSEAIKEHLAGKEVSVTTARVFG
jgi:hypothetical protein